MTLKQRTQKAEKEFLGCILELFKRNPYACFTAKDVIEYLGLIGGENKWYTHGHLNILKEKGEIVKLAPGKGFKYKNKTVIAS